ncbi:MAG: FHIPEP family type III secretion protein, partial [Deltaproteobacteria bacterium]|nr:FHIPEP family type III secretion protein [Deltaproteobacteria bacterium]
MAGILDNIKGFKRGYELIVPAAIVGILAVMILPVPPLALDLLLTFSITVAIMILLISVYITRPLDFATFPTLLLVTTLFRLALNVASTRLILLHGSDGADAAGQVIKSFGNFVVGGNYAVGFVVFAILVIINFVVITKGAGRIAEVAARFTLDAMPGKQMAIDADLNA